MAGHISLENEDSEGQINLESVCMKGQSASWTRSCRMLSDVGAFWKPFSLASQISSENLNSEGAIQLENLCMEGHSSSSQ